MDEYVATVKKYDPRGFGFLINPMPGGRDIFFRSHDGPVKEGSRVLVLREIPHPKGPRATKWRLIAAG